MLLRVFKKNFKLQMLLTLMKDCESSANIQFKKKTAFRSHLGFLRKLRKHLEKYVEKHLNKIESLKNLTFPDDVICKFTPILKRSLTKKL